MGHVDKKKKHAVENGVDGPPKPRVREWMIPDKRRKRIVPKVHRLLNWSMKTRGNKSMGARMDGRFAEEGQKRQQEKLILETEIQQEHLLQRTEMCTRMDEGPKKRRRMPDTWCRMIQ